MLKTRAEIVDKFPLDRCPFRCYIIPMITNDPTRAADSQDHRPVQDQSPTDQASDPSPRCEDAPCCGCCPSSHEAYDPYPEPEPYDGWGGCWPGDGSGMDDLADYNQMEGDDY